MMGQATLSARVAAPQKTNSARAGRSCRGSHACMDRYRTPTSRPTTDRSTAGPDQRRDPSRHTQPQAQCPDVAETEGEGQRRDHRQDPGHRSTSELFAGQRHLAAVGQDAVIGWHLAVLMVRSLLHGSSSLSDRVMGIKARRGVSAPRRAVFNEIV